MPDLDDLYQELILDHYRRPRNRGRLEDASGRAEGYNPLCGDRVTVFVKLDGDVVRDVKFEASGCAISTAAASLMSEAVRGKSLAEARALFRKFHGMVTGAQPPGNNGPELGKLEVFGGLNQYPARVKCATLAWHTLDAALENRHETVTTE